MEWLKGRSLVASAILLVVGSVACLPASASGTSEQTSRVVTCSGSVCTETITIFTVDSLGNVTIVLRWFRVFPRPTTQAH